VVSVNGMSAGGGGGGGAADPAVEAAARRATGALIAQLRIGLGLTYEEMGRRSGMTAGAIQRYERGNAIVVELCQLRAMAGVLGVTAGELVDAGRPVRPHEAEAPDDRSPGQRPVFVLAAVTDETIGPGFRLIRWTPTPLGTRWAPRDSYVPRVTRPVLDWASTLLGAPAYVAGPATDMLGSPSWYLGAMGPRDTRSTDRAPLGAVREPTAPH